MTSIQFLHRRIKDDKLHIFECNRHTVSLLIEMYVMMLRELNIYPCYFVCLKLCNLATTHKEPKAILFLTQMLLIIPRWHETNWLQVDCILRTTFPLLSNATSSKWLKPYFILRHFMRYLWYTWIFTKLSLLLLLMTQFIDINQQA